ncbi:Rv3235 family protein [Nocardiopsis sp. FIRDI 009]|uniref:Rv3235 family protein n=1 Tax=Nocardiopsis sp. FIRDI 009 TaxID=714197 RepID=UPI000E25CFC0|nr:Rv3235 family protein [Nocardiopsis sp. FIRDI 009]
MPHAARHPLCPRPACHHGRTPAHRPAPTPARTPLRRPRAGRCGAPLQGHRTPGDVYHLAQRMAEVLVGRRAPEVLRDQLAAPVREELRRLRGSVPCGIAPRLGRVFHQSHPPASLEVSAVIACDRRARAFAFRADRAGGRWVCTLLETDRVHGSLARSRQTRR